MSLFPKTHRGLLRLQTYEFCLSSGVSRTAYVAPSLSQIRRLSDHLQSKECQKISWKLTHKYTCVRIAVPPGKEELLKHTGRIINAWQNVWKDHLDHFALMALDLANNPGKNTTHWYVLLLSDDRSGDLFFRQHVARVHVHGTQGRLRKIRGIDTTSIPLYPLPPHNFNLYGVDLPRVYPHNRGSPR